MQSLLGEVLQKISEPSPNNVSTIEKNPSQTAENQAQPQNIHQVLKNFSDTLSAIQADVLDLKLDTFWGNPVSYYAKHSEHPQDYPALEMNKLYKQYIGYTYERQEYHVTYGDKVLICRRGETVEVIQSKNPHPGGIIDDNVVQELEQTTQSYAQEYTKLNVQGVLKTSARLTMGARMSAEQLGMNWLENLNLERFPSVKCITTQTGERLFFCLLTLIISTCF